MLLFKGGMGITLPNKVLHNFPCKNRASFNSPKPANKTRAIVVSAAESPLSPGHALFFYNHIFSDACIPLSSAHLHTFNPINLEDPVLRQLTPSGLFETEFSAAS